MTPAPRPLDREAHARRVDDYTRLVESRGWILVVESLRRRQEQIRAEVMNKATPLERVGELRALHAEIETIIGMPEADRHYSAREVDRLAPRPGGG